MEQAISMYLAYLKDIKHYSKQTVSAYSFDLKDFLDYSIKNKLIIDEIIDKDINGYINELKINNYKVTSINRKIVCLRNFFKHYVTHINTEALNPMINYSTLKAPKRLPKDLFKEQLKVLLKLL